MYHLPVFQLASAGQTQGFRQVVIVAFLPVHAGFLYSGNDRMIGEQQRTRPRLRQAWVIRAQAAPDLAAAEMAAQMFRHNQAEGEAAGAVKQIAGQAHECTNPCTRPFLS